jgi:ABC-type multidrug transport system fused ATPase/permease subunit
MIRSTVALHDLAELLNMETGISEQVRRTRVQEEAHSLMITATSRSKQSRKQRRRQKAANYGLVSGNVNGPTANGSDAAPKGPMKTSGGDASFFIPPISVSAKKIVPTAAGIGKAAGGEEGVVFANDREQLLRLKLITVRDCTFTYPSLQHCTKDSGMHTMREERGAPVVKGLNLDVPLGNLVWLATPEGVQGTGIGRLTLMKLLAGLLAPTAGTVTVPAHLKVRMVHHTPLLFAKSLLYNLTLGSKEEGITDKAWLVARQCGLSEELIGQADLQVECACLVYTPCMHRPIPLYEYSMSTA